jgi:DNA replication protein DnaC
MERLNDIIARAAQRQQQGAEQEPPHGPSAQAQRPGSSSSRYSLREQTARLGPGSRTVQSRYQHRISPRTRSEQTESMPQAPRSTYYRQRLRANEQVELEADQRYPQHQMDVERHPRTEEFAPARDHNWGASRMALADSADAYSAVVQADVLEEWEDDTADMRYGDWESDGNEEYTQPRPHDLGAIVNSMHTINRATPRDAQTLPQNKRSFITRELHMPPDTEPGQHAAYMAGDASTPQRLLPAPQQEVRRPPRMTQPLRPQAAVRVSQDISQERPRTQKPVVQAPRREQVVQYTPPVPVSQCPVCRGAGYLRADVPFGHPNFGKPIACECKEAERKEKRRQQLQEMSNLGAFYDKGFENFNARVPGLQEAFRAACEFARSPDGWLLFIGPNGCGKTHLAAAIANQSLEDGACVLFATVPDLLDYLRAAFAPTSTEVYDQLFARMREAEVLVLDDLGAQQSSPWANEKLFQLLNYRYNSRFPTVITANTKGLQAIDERIRSRLTDASLVTTVILDRTRDYRPNNPRRG